MTDLAGSPLPADTVGLLEGLTTTRIDPPLHRRAGSARRRCGRCCSRRPGRRAARTVSRSGSSCSPTGRSRARPRRSIGAAARAGVGRRSARATATTVGSGADDDSPEGAHGARRCSATSTSFERVPVLILPCLVRYREPDAVRGGVGLPGVSRTCCSRRARSATAASLTGLARARGGRAARAAAASPTTCSSPRRSRSGGPRGHNGPVRRRPLAGAGVRGPVGRARPRGPSTRPARGSPRPARRSPTGTLRHPEKDSRHDVGLLDRARVRGEARLDRRVRRDRDRADRPRVRPRTLVYDKTHPVHREVHPAAAGAGEGAGPVGVPPRSRPRRPRLRPGEARADERDPRPLDAGRRSTFGCQAPDSGNAEILAHYGTAGAEGEVPAAAARRRDRLAASR